MDGYDDGYGTQQQQQQQPYPQYRRVLIDSSGRVIADDSQPMRIRYADRPTAQVYRIGPRFNASVTRVDRRGSVDSGLAQVYRVGGAAGPRFVRVAAGVPDNEQRLSQPASPQVIHLGSGRMRVVGADADATPRQLYRVVAVDPNNPSRSAVRYHDAGAAAVVPPPVHQFQTSGYGGRGGGSGGGGDQRPPLSPDSAGPRLVSYSIHPVGSETDFARPRAVYSSEWHAPMNRQFPGGPGTCCSPTSGGWVPVTADNPSYEPSQFQGGNASDADAYGNQAGADGRRRFRIQIGGPESNEGTDSFQQGHQTALPFLHQPAYYHASQQAPSDQPTTPSNPAYSDAGVTPSFTVRAVGPVTDFGELVCESIRQFLLHKQRQQQQQQQQIAQGQSSVPWRRPRDFVVQSSVVAAPQSGATFAATQSGATAPRPPPIAAAAVFRRKPSSSDADRMTPPTSPEVASPTVAAEDRNMFQRYNFQFGSIGDFGRDDAAAVAVDGAARTGTGNRAERSRRAGSDTAAAAATTAGPIAVFRFQDFDDMVARMRDQSQPQTSSAVAANATQPGAGSSQVYAGVPHLQQQQQLQRAWSGARSDTEIDEETDADSGYNTSRSVPDHYQLADVTAPAVTPAGCDARVPSDWHVDSHEELRRKIATFNDNSHGSIMSLEQNSNVFHGFIRVVMNLIRPVQMSLSSQPTSVYDVIATSRDQNSSAAEVTTFHLPKDTTKVIHITSETTTREVIRMLLAKFHIQDNPRKFALYEQREDGDQGDGYMRRLADMERPLPVCLHWADAGTDTLNRTRFVLQENDTGEVMWEAFSLPELESFLLILYKEEETYLQEIRETYHALKIHMQRRLKQLRQDRVGPGAKLKPTVA